MTDENQDLPMASGTPSNTPRKQVAEGQSEFSVKPEEFMKLIGGDQAHTDPNNAKKLAGIKEKTTQTSNINRHSSGDPDKDAMADILTKFHSVESGEQPKQSQPQQINENVQEADYKIVDEEWQIQPIINESNPNKPMFAVQHTQTGTYIASDLRLYETAQKLSEALNNGHQINSPEISKILYYEQTYKDSAKKAGQTKKQMRKLGESKELKRKYNDSINEAKTAKNSLKRMIL